MANPQDCLLQRLRHITLKAKAIDFTILFCKYLDFMIKHHEVILEWLESKAYEEQYLKTNHPYPPLLDPKRLKPKKH